MSDRLGELAEFRKSLGKYVSRDRRLDDGGPKAGSAQVALPCNVGSSNIAALQNSPFARCARPSMFLGGISKGVRNAEGLLPETHLS